MYIIMFIVILLLSLIGTKYKDNKHIINIYLLLLLIMMCLRYGQGTDYFAYKYLFNQVKELGYLSNLIHGEIGFKLICSIFTNKFEILIIIISIYEIYMLKRFIDKKSEKKSLSLLIFFPSIFMIYYLSALRQGIIFATILGCIDLIEKEEWKKFTLIIIILSTIHIVALVYLLIPLSTKIKTKHLLTILPISIVLGIINNSGLLTQVLFKLPLFNKYLHYNIANISLLMFFEKLISMLVILYLCKKCDKNNFWNAWWLKAYLMGHIVFFILLPFSTMAGRIVNCFKLFEIYFIPIIILNSNKSKLVGYIYFIMLSVIMYCHNVNSFIEQGKYYSNINVINFPYISIIEKDKIYEYRDVNSYNLYKLTDNE